jgi:hypothetical protein
VLVPVLVVVFVAEVAVVLVVEDAVVVLLALLVGATAPPAAALSSPLLVGAGGSGSPASYACNQRANETAATTARGPQLVQRRPSLGMKNAELARAAFFSS